MNLLDILAREWPALQNAKWTVFSLLATALAIGWTAGRFMYGERIAILKERIAGYEDKLNGASPDEAKRRIEQLEERIQQLQSSAPRALTAEQMASIKNAAQSAPGRILVTYDSAAQDGPSLQAQLLSAFRKAGWNASGNFMAGGEEPNTHSFVLNLPSERSSASNAAGAALSAANLPFSSGQMTSTYDADAEIVIYARLD